MNFKVESESQTDIKCLIIKNKIYILPFWAVSVIDIKYFSKPYISQIISPPPLKLEITRQKEFVRYSPILHPMHTHSNFLTEILYMENH